jgi:6-pyruvoyltetrahydropterin/6-carboxytetrahydropterin synthase
MKDTKVTCTRKLEFDAGHRVYKHESKCAHLHGHRYVVEVTAQADELDEVGRTIDFSVLKEKIGGWLDEKWDHGMIMNDVDPLAKAVGRLEVVPRPGRNEVGTLQKLYLMPCNPTAENMASYLLDVICPDLLAGAGVDVVKVLVWETPNCKAEASL